MNRFVSIFLGTSLLTAGVAGCGYTQVASTTATPQQVLHESAPMVPAPTQPATATVVSAAPTTAPTAAPAQPTSAPTAASQPTPAATRDATQWERVNIPDAGLSVEVPKSWQRQGIEWSWAAGTSGARVGVNWNDITPGWQPNGMLPNHANLSGPTTVDLGWAKGQTYTAEVSGSAAQGGQLQAVESHTIVQLGGKRAYDFFVVGKNAQEVAAAQPILSHLAESVVLRGG
ncbi:MAG TPA: hypothetical protein VFZ25_02180 [Chloroflexota bacterium]|nr:hypothetical protein [Chloroflexota bacterium]